MTEAHYSKFDGSQLILRDELAIDRTLLANERTLLAYLRSGVALVIAGVSIMHFAMTDWFWLVGASCIPLGIMVAGVGILRHRTMSRAILRVRNQIKKETPHKSPA